ncbi:MAG: histidine--tRNA ligase [Candidatus Tokpelaia sp.]|nr:MAG: histidine--tRNA ligase [Candidatus Tokpelaia sp.]KAA6205776.1 MAG: histidine--tRNA ligase [Candidatus Tokpelaia sp.]
MMEEAKIKARKPHGFADRRADELLYAGRLAEKIGTVYRLYGFEPMETPFIEFTEALGKFLPDKERPNEGVFSFQDDDEQWLSLRYDLTAPLARFYAENMADLPRPFRSFRNGWVFRNEKAKPGRFRQFLQFDADTVGTSSPAADAELCMMGADTLEYLGLQRGDFAIRVNNRKIMDGILENIGLGSNDTARKLTVMRAMDKLDKIGLNGVGDLLGKGRLDESGDFTKGAELPAAARDIVLRFLQANGKSATETLDNLQALAGTSIQGQEGVAELRQMQALFDAAGYGRDRIKIDPSIVRGLEYYTGPVFEAELGFALVNKDGVKTTIGSIGGGGRYDGLVSRFSDNPVPATGFSIGLSRLMAGLKHSGKLGAGEEQGPVLVLAMDRDGVSLALYQKMVSELRQAGIKSELYLGEAGMKAQMKYADKRKAPCVLIQGSQERAAGTVEIKDLIEGARLAGQIADNEKWRQENPAQSAVARPDIVAAVQKILARHSRQ